MGDRNGALLAEKTARASGIAVATPNVMALPLQELCKKRACRAGSKNKDAHDVEKLYHRLCNETAAGLCPGAVAGNWIC